MVLRLHFIKDDLVLRQNSIKRNLEKITREIFWFEITYYKRLHLDGFEITLHER